MIKLKDILIEGGKLFAPHSQRVTTKEMDILVDKLREKLSDLFVEFQTTKSLKSKKDHGDVDILVQPKTNLWKNKLEKILGDQILNRSTNGNVHSYLIYCPTINKKVHVDFIVAGDKNKFLSMSQFYILNDFSAAVGIFAKSLNFLYGSQGFQKRYMDKRKQWHTIYITNNLMDGLEILGYKNPKTEIEKLETLDDIIKFLITSPLLDYTYFESDNLNADQKKDARGRDNIGYILHGIVQSKTIASIFDEDYFFKKLFPKLYDATKKKIEKIEKETYIQSKYNGKWLIDNFNLKPGPQIGYILRQLTKHFGGELENADENEVKKFVETLI